MRCKPHERIALKTLQWLADACGGLKFSAVEQYLVGPDIWSFRALVNDAIRAHSSERTILLRVVGVEHCALFGLELEVIHRELGFPPAPMNIPVIDNRFDLALRHVKVLIWTTVSAALSSHLPSLIPQNEQPPRAHRVSFNDDNTLQLGLHTPLDADLTWTRVNLWLAEDAEWSVVSIEDSFWLSADYDTVLLRVPGTMHPLGLGREMHALDCKHDRPENFGDVPFKPTENVRSSTWRRPHADRIPDGGRDCARYRTSI